MEKEIGRERQREIEDFLGVLDEQFGYARWERRREKERKQKKREREEWERGSEEK
jgi:hypothetical protein